MPLDKNILKKKVFGIPVPIVALGAGVVGVIAFKKFGGGGGGGGAADSAATPADYSQGAAGAGGSASDYSGGTGDVGSSADLGLGGGGGGGYANGGGGGFLPATDAGGIGGQPIVNKVVRIIRPVRHVRRVKLVNKVVINPRWTPPNKRRPNVVHNDKPMSHKPYVPVAQKPRPKLSPPIIKPPVRKSVRR